MVTPQQRRAFLDERRAIAKQRYDRLHSPTYDEDWSEISPTHRAFIQRLLALTAPDALVVDVECGTGKYWERCWPPVAGCWGWISRRECSTNSRHKKYGPMMPGRPGGTFQLSITKPTGSLSKYTARYHGLASGVAAASSSDLATEATKRSW